MDTQNLLQNNGIPESLYNYLTDRKKQDAIDFNSLTERKRKELLHHNLQRDSRLNHDIPKDMFEKLHGNKKFYSTVRLVREYGDIWIANNAKDKIFIDYACGTGERAIRAAQLGAKLAIGIDLSDISLEYAKILAAEAGVSDRCHFLQVDCENTGLPDNCADIIYCSGVLHHLDLSYAFPEIRRILKPGGRALALEALDYNPAIKLYRSLTPEMRTEWEKNHILSLKDIRFAERFFDMGEIRYWHLLSIAAVMFRKNPKIMNFALNILNAIDKIVLKIPYVQLMAWMFTFEVYKRKDV